VQHYLYSRQNTDTLNKTNCGIVDRIFTINRHRNNRSYS